MRRQYQKYIDEVLVGSIGNEVHFRMRHKLKRWDIRLFPRVRADRALHMLARLNGLVPPRVSSAVFRTLWNGWITSRRFQRNGSCVFGCRCGEDSIEHYSVCKHVWDFSSRYLRLHPPPGDVHLRRRSFLILDEAGRGENTTLTLSALRVAAVYRAYLLTVHGDYSAEVAREMLPQTLRHAVRGHPEAMKATRIVWHSQ